MKKKLVIAGNYQQFKNWFMFWKRIKGYEDSEFVSSIDKLYGQDKNKVELMLIGEYWLSPVYNDERFVNFSEEFKIIKPPINY